MPLNSTDNNGIKYTNTNSHALTVTLLVALIVDVFWGSHGGDNQGFGVKGGPRHGELNRKLLERHLKDMTLEDLKKHREQLECLGCKVAEAVTLIIREIRRKENR